MSEKEKPPIRLKMKVGNIEFEIECQEDQLKGAVEQIISTITEKAREISIAPEQVPKSTRLETCRGVIQSLWAEGWFSTPRSLSDVHSQMALRGFHYDRTAVAHTLVDLVREGTLTRVGRPRRYRYVQKKPPPRVSI